MVCQRAIQLRLVRSLFRSLSLLAPLAGPAANRTPKSEIRRRAVGTARQKSKPRGQRRASAGSERVSKSLNHPPRCCNVVTLQCRPRGRLRHFNDSTVDDHGEITGSTVSSPKEARALTGIWSERGKRASFNHTPRTTDYGIHDMGRRTQKFRAS